MRRYLTIFLYAFFIIAAGSANAETAHEKLLNTHLLTLTKDQAQLQTFVEQMPKGGDLHNHLGGAAYPEQLLAYAQADHFCLRVKDMTAYDGNCDESERLNALDATEPMRDQIIDAWSMRHFSSLRAPYGHDHFFATFGKFSAIGNQHLSDIMAQLARHAAQQHISYLELMITLDKDASGRLGKTIGWVNDFAAMQEKLMQAGLMDIVKAMPATLSLYESKASRILNCDHDKSLPACQVTTRYLYQVLREQPPEMVFAQLLAGFLVAEQDSRMVGINMVQPEDGKISMRDYHLQMQMVGYLKKQFPNVKVALHAGELTSDFAPAEGLSFHINDAVLIAHADRIGHGVDINSENNRDGLLSYMADHKIAVEINLTSNANILGVSGHLHPVSSYRKFHVPVALSTDDEGITRASLSHEYRRAISEQQFSYHDLKMTSRYSLEYAFISGQSLWSDIEKEKIMPACAASLASNQLTQACDQYLAANKKAALQYQLEKDWSQFEARFHPALH